MTIAIYLYLIVMFAVAFWARSRIKDHEDYIVAGRRLPLGLSSFTLLATWFGAGTLLTATDEIYAEGLAPALLEPYGAGCALLIAGLFFAKPLWEMKLCTVTDFYKRKYGPKVEFICVLSSVLGFAGWIAVQLVALAGVVQVFYGVPIGWGVVGIAMVAMIYTLLGGMWSVTITDCIQLLIIILGLVVLGVTAYAHLGDGSIAAGIAKVLGALEPEALVLVPAGSLPKVLSCLNVFLIASLGNIPSQDLGQRIFAARSASTARSACLIAGFLYIAAGTIPVGLGLAAKAFYPDFAHSVIPSLAGIFLSPAMTIVFVLAIFSAVLSTIDSAILAPATTLAHNGLRHLVPEKVSTLRLCHISVIAITAASVLVALSGERAYLLLEQCYAIGLAAFFAPLVIGLLVKEPSRTGGVLSMAVGLAIWPLEFVVEADIPFALIAALAGLAAYYLYTAFERRASAAA